MNFAFIVAMKRCAVVVNLANSAHHGRDYTHTELRGRAPRTGRAIYLPLRALSIKALTVASVFSLVPFKPTEVKY